MRSIVLILVAYCFFCASVERSFGEGEIYDAVFSPDGRSIAVGSSMGFQLYDRETMECTNSIDTEGGVRFIRWSPDGDKVLLAHWIGDPEQTKPTYSIWNFVTHEKLYSFDDPILWLKGYGQIPYTTYASINERLYPSIECLHCNSIAFSPNGEQIAYLCDDNRIKIVNIHNGELFDVIDGENYHMSSLGYKSDDELWIGILFEDQFGFSEVGKVVYYSLSTGQQRDVVVYIDQNGYGYATAPLSLTFDGQYIILHHSGEAPGGVGWISGIGAQNALTDDRFALCSGYYYMMHDPPVRLTSRWIYLPLQNKFKCLYVNAMGYHNLMAWGINEIDLDRPRDIVKILNEELPLEGFLLQPFSPDGEWFLNVYQGELYLFDADTMEREKILSLPSNVCEFESLYEKR